MQRFAAVGIIRVDGEYLVNVFGAFDTEEECETYITNTVAGRFDTFDLYSVSMYEWIFPSAVVGKPPSAAVKFGYRHQQLHDAMTGAVEDEQRVQQFEEQCRASGLTEDKYVTELTA